MRRLVHLLFVSGLVAGAVAGLGGTALAQTGTGDLAAFCAARLEANAAETKAENIAVLTKMVAAAPAAVSTPMAGLLALFKKQGDKAFESKEGTALLATLEPYIYENCPGRQLAVTAIDYEYQGIPATLPAGVTKIKLTNAAPKEGHMRAGSLQRLLGERRGHADAVELPSREARCGVGGEHAPEVDIALTETCLRQPLQEQEVVDEPLLRRHCLSLHAA